MTNPDAVTGMLKQSLGGIVPQIAMGTFVSFFFSGFILGRVPFPLSPSFRVMLQRGVDLPSGPRTSTVSSEMVVQTTGAAGRTNSICAGLGM